MELVTSRNVKKVILEPILGRKKIFEIKKCTKRVCEICLKLPVEITDYFRPTFPLHTL